MGASTTRLKAIDPTTSPRRIEFEHSTVQEAESIARPSEGALIFHLPGEKQFESKRVVFSGIYKLAERIDGTTELTYCVANDEGHLPSQFKADANSNCTLVRLERHHESLKTAWWTPMKFETPSLSRVK